MFLPFKGNDVQRTKATNWTPRKIMRWRGLCAGTNSVLWHRKQWNDREKLQLHLHFKVVLLGGASSRTGIMVTLTNHSLGSIPGLKQNFGEGVLASMSLNVSAFLWGVCTRGLAHDWFHFCSDRGTNCCLIPRIPYSFALDNLTTRTGHHCILIYNTFVGFRCN